MYDLFNVKLGKIYFERFELKVKWRYYFFFIDDLFGRKEYLFRNIKKWIDNGYKC